MKKTITFFILISFLALFNFFSFEITDQKAIELGKQWYPDELRAMCINLKETPCVDQPDFGKWLHDPGGYGDYHPPKIFTIPNDPNVYVLLAWEDCSFHSTLWWRILKTNDDGKTFQLVCDNANPVDDGGMQWAVKPMDLTGDGIPELVWNGVNLGMANWGGNEAIAVWGWKNGCFTLLMPLDPYDESETMCVSGLYSNTSVRLADIDEDGKAEIIVGQQLDHHWNVTEEGYDDITWTVSEPGEVWRYDGEKFVKWFELDPNDPNPIYVQSLGVFHPSTIPFSELSNPGNGKISIFVSDPAGPLTADNFVTNSFTYNKVSLTFKKIWKNNKQPDESSANFEFSGVPVKQFVRKSQGEWQTNPSDPFILSPYGAMEYHFCGKYVELETNRALIFPELKQKAEKFFNIHPDKTTYLATIPIKAKFGNSNKISQISAMICIKKTGYQEKAEETKKVDEKNKPEPNRSKKK
jgi:hypothetical protein